MKILLTGGGSGGHVYPLLAIARKIQDLEFKNHELRYYGPESRYNELLRQEGIAVHWVMAAKLRRYFSLLNLLDIFKFGLAVLQGLWHLAWWRPDVAFSKGGTGALPVLLACRLYGVPIIIHESDAVMGLTNKISARWAAKVFEAWGSSGIGIPLRAEIIAAANKVASDPNFQAVVKRQFGFEPGKPLLLVVGGSQGAQRINKFIFENLPALLEKYQVLHQVGEANFAESKIIIFNHHIVSSFNAEEMARAYAAADLIISRAGSAIFEMAAFGKPAILIPLPEAAHNHQLLNAQAYAAFGAALVLEEPNLRLSESLRLMREILGDRERYQKMASAARNFAKLDSTEIIIKYLLTLNKEG